MPPKKKARPKSSDTSPKSEMKEISYGTSRFNATKHAVLSKYTVLPWEDTKEYEDLLSSVIEEYSPKGPTEMHLVEELAGIIWRKRRLRIAEAGCFGLEKEESEIKFNNPDEISNQVEVAAQWMFNYGMEESKSDQKTPDDLPIPDLSGPPPDTGPEFEVDPTILSKYFAGIKKVERNEFLDVNELFSPVARKRWDYFWDTFNKGYLSPDDRDEDKFPEFNRQMLLTFLKIELATYLRIYEIIPPNIERNYRDAIHSARKIEYDSMAKLSRYETSLDRKFEKTLQILIRLQEIRLKKEALEPDK